MARPPAARRRDLQARQRRRPAGRAARPRLLARDVVEPGGLDARAGAMIAARPAQARGAAADPARRGRCDVRARRGLALRPGRRLRRRRDQVSPERRAEIAAGLGLRPVAARALRPLARNVAQGDLGNSVVAGGQPVAGEILARTGASLVLIGGALAARAGRRPRVRRARGRAARDGRRRADPRAVVLQRRRAVVLARAAGALRVLDRARLAARGRAVRSALRGRRRRRPAHLVLPMLVLALTQYAWFTLFVRNTLLEVLREDHVQFSRAHGHRRGRGAAAPCAADRADPVRDARRHATWPSSSAARS